MHSVVGPTRPFSSPVIRFSHFNVLSQCTEVSVRIHMVHENCKCISKTNENVLIGFNSNYSAIYKTITQIFLITYSVLTKLPGFKRYDTLKYMYIFLNCQRVVHLKKLFISILEGKNFLLAEVVLGLACFELLAFEICSCLFAVMQFASRNVLYCTFLFRFPGL